MICVLFAWVLRLIVGFPGAGCGTVAALTVECTTKSGSECSGLLALQKAVLVKRE